MSLTESDRRRDDARMHLIGIARAMIVETSGRGFSMRELVARAGFSSKTIYRLFQSKDAILRDLMLLNTDEFMREAEAIATANPIDDLFATIRLAADFSFRDPEFTRATQACLFGLGATEQNELEIHFAQFWHRHVVRLHEGQILDAAIDPAILGRHLSNLYFGAIRQDLLHRLSREQFEAHLGYAFAIACGGLALSGAHSPFLDAAIRYEALLLSD